MASVTAIRPGIISIDEDLLDNELGSAYTDLDLLFTAFEKGDVFKYDTASVKALDEMLERDGKAATLEQVLTLPIRQAPWTVRRGPATKAATDLVTKILCEPANNGGMTTPMNEVLAQMTSAFVYRKAFFEKVFTIRDERVVYDRLAWRPPQTCAVVRDDMHGNFRGFKQRPVRPDDTDQVYIKPNRAFVYIHNTRRDPLEGKSDFDIAYWCYITKQKILYLWFSYLEGQSLPKTIVSARNETDAQKGALKVKDLKQGGIIGITDALKLDTLESSGKGADQFMAAIRWLESQASGSVLAGFTDLGSTAVQGTGSFALSKDQTDFFLMSQAAKSKEMAACINSYMIPDLVKYNLGSKAASPIIEIGPITQDDANLAVGLLQATAVSASPVLPREFYAELIERVAGLLELDVARVREGLERAAKEGEQLTPMNPAVGSVAGAVGAATAAVQTQNRQYAKGTKKSKNDPGPAPRIGADMPRIVATDYNKVR